MFLIQAVSDHTETEEEMGFHGNDAPPTFTQLDVISDFISNINNLHAVAKEGWNAKKKNPYSL